MLRKDRIWIRFQFLADLEQVTSYSWTSTIALGHRSSIPRLLSHCLRINKTIRKSNWVISVCLIAINNRISSSRESLLWAIFHLLICCVSRRIRILVLIHSLLRWSWMAQNHSEKLLIDICKKVNVNFREQIHIATAYQQTQKASLISLLVLNEHKVISIAHLIQASAFSAKVRTD